MMTPPIAIVGMACRYPDARSPEELWENVLSQRRAFRRIPAERLSLADYFSADRGAPDCIYISEAAFVENYEFDRVGFRVTGEAYESSDMAHWLALDMAARALGDGGFEGGEGLPRETTAVFLGNTLTGEFSRANAMRLRWPFVRRVVEAALAGEGVADEARAGLLARMESAYKSYFPPVGGESLAGGLSNTIAGRVCSHFDLKGGGYTVDGACSSSLLAVANACSALAAGDIDVALAGGVDLSIDPFELVGFAKAGALASAEMLVYDARSDGFWPGEGCGFVTLMRHDDAVAGGRRVYALVRGWGVSSDGSGGITRPEVEGQMLALRRAYARAGFGIETASYFEGHGTGTSVGDAVELKALSAARRHAAPNAAPAAVGSVKANIGHTKAAAGVAGLIKATMAVHRAILPPTTACREPHPELASESPALRVLREGELWDGESPLRAGVSAMGFGGINTHVVIEGRPGPRRRSLSPREAALLSSAQDAELLLLGADSPEGLRQEVWRLLGLCDGMSRAEVGDLAARLAHELDPTSSARAAVVALTPAQLAAQLRRLLGLIESGTADVADAQAGLFYKGRRERPPHVGFLFPGQGSPVYSEGGAWARRFDYVRRIYSGARLPADGGGTAAAQPAIVASSLAGLRALEELDVRGAVAVGHSLGELTALHWAGALDAEALLGLAAARGEIMAATGGPEGAMASIAAGRPAVEALMNGDRLVIAGVNSPGQTVISGGAQAVRAVMERARASNLGAVLLPVSHAFHSPLVGGSVPPLAARLLGEFFGSLGGTVYSTVTGTRLDPEIDLREHLCRQVTSPVLFMEATEAAAREGVDLWLEVGPGRTLCGLVGQFQTTPVVSLDSGGESLRGLLLAAGAVFVSGGAVNAGALFAGRVTRPYKLSRRPTFFTNPCERAPVNGHTKTLADAGMSAAAPNAQGSESSATAVAPVRSESALDLLVRLIAERAALPPSAVSPDHRLLSDLHLNSIIVAQLVSECARLLGLGRPVAPTLYAGATVMQVAESLEKQLQAGPPSEGADAGASAAGVAAWVRPFVVELTESPLRAHVHLEPGGFWRVFAPAGDQLAEQLRGRLSADGRGKGVVVCLPPRPGEEHVGLLIEGARALTREAEGGRFVLVQHGGGAAAFARTLRRELGAPTVVVDVPEGAAGAADRVLAEALAALDYTEAHYDSQGRRREPVVRPLTLAEDSAGVTLMAEDVLVVTGGAKGITAECALALARKTGVRLALFGRSLPESSPEVASNLERLDAAGVAYRYYALDVTDEGAVRRALALVEEELGAVTGILHGAALNDPVALADLDEHSFRKTVAVKLDGARNLLRACDPDRLRLLVTFGSIIARCGLPGEAHYGTANEWLSRLTDEWRAAHPSCTCLALEWSVWSGAGMGVRSGNLDALAQQGIAPIPTGEGTETFCRLLERRVPPAPVVVMSRMPEMETFRLERAELPLLRFLEQPRAYFPGAELVTDVELSAATDIYLDDHRLHGERLLPAVVGLEAMAQVAAALSGEGSRPSFSDVRFERPVVVPESAPLRVRVAAHERLSGAVDLSLRSEETGFHADHFAATCVFEGGAAERPATAGLSEVSGWKRLALDPEHDLYGRALFHGERFRRLSGYRALSARGCVAEIKTGLNVRWFGNYLPQQLLLGDPGARDAAIHAVQACIPHRRLLPIGVKKISLFGVADGDALFVRARERASAGDEYEYDLELFDPSGRVLELWEGLKLRAVEVLQLPEPLPWPLVAPYFEWRVRETGAAPPPSFSILRSGSAARRSRSDFAFRTVLGRDGAVVRTPHGKPEVADAEDVSVSSAHALDLTMAAAGRGALGCDIEFVEGRVPSAWLDLIGEERLGLARLISESTGEDAAASATRVWVAGECLIKAGAPVSAPLVMAPARGEDGFVRLSSGRYSLATLVVRLRGYEKPLALGALTETV